ncbi:hypothetical protein HYW44_00150 [Candidatus Daviesbacteria bacterium]|nr:hypothetical protein [Candidatus Daviesbacteria bacterium]
MTNKLLPVATIILILILGLVAFWNFSHKKLGAQFPVGKITEESSPQAFTKVESIASPSASPQDEYIEFAGKKIRVVRVGEGEYCEGRVGFSDYDIAKCNQGLKCQFNEGSAADAPGLCVPE